jgi:K+-transporting ATPase A subunit
VVGALLKEREMNLVYGLIVFGLTAALSWPLGRYMAWVLGRPHSGPIDRTVARWLGPNVLEPQSWKTYALSLIVLNALMFGIVLLILLYRTHGGKALHELSDHTLPTRRAQLPRDIA